MSPSTSESPQKSPKPLSVLESILNRVLGFSGGLVVAGIVSLVFLYARALLHFSGWIWLGVSILLFAFFAIYCFWKPRGFDMFSGPILSAFLNDPGPVDSGLGDSDYETTWKEFLARIAYILGLVCLGIGVFFLIHFLVILGIGLIVYYVVFEIRNSAHIG
jgi:hypothetical protein